MPLTGSEIIICLFLNEIHGDTKLLYGDMKLLYGDTERKSQRYLRKAQSFQAQR